MAGSLVISLDFELHWGVRDRLSVEAYRENLLGARKVIPVLLELFREYRINATWAIVGALFCSGREELLEYAPRSRPRYANRILSADEEFERVGCSEEADPYHFAPSLIRMVQSVQGQEIATHTFSHYYAMEPGQTNEDFRADLQAAIAVAKEYGVQFRSIVFPRNQVNSAYLPICAALGIVAYRGRECDPLNAAGNGISARLMRLADTYVKITRDHVVDWTERPTIPVSVPQNRFLRPFSMNLKALDRLKISRICNSMTDAARSDRTYHLWWHPHNFGSNIPENMNTLRRILDHYAVLNAQYGFASESMLSVATRVAESSSGSTVVTGSAGE